jgi:transcriptional antiterminator NusG
MDEAKWYVVHTYSGYENKVKNDIDMTVENRGLEDQILEVLVPMENVVETKNGNKKETTRKMFPGYVLVKMIMNEETWYIVRNTRGVTGFVGPGSKPVPLTYEEIKTLGIMMPDSPEEKPAAVIDFRGKPGDRALLIGGALVGMEGVIDTVNVGKQTVILKVDLLGTDTPLEVGFENVRIL